MQLAPMIDVIMFLLTFFFVTWNLSRYELDLQVKTPAAKTGRPAKQTAGEVVVNIRKDGSITLNRRMVDQSELENVLVELVKSFPEQVMVLRVDGEAPYKYTMNVLDICNRAKLHNIAFAASREEPKPAAPAP
ncbi:MAG: ExbD/TolR family protein [Candidatus Methylacidiphilales bacterium]|nr:biopolymer transporter ExbD [Candidatus Methylacidiphilales bacterium]